MFWSTIIDDNNKSNYHTLCFVKGENPQHQLEVIVSKIGMIYALLSGDEWWIVTVDVMRMMMISNDDDDNDSDDYYSHENFDWVDWIDNLKCQSEHIM